MTEHKDQKHVEAQVEKEPKPMKVEVVAPQPHVFGHNSGIDTTKEGGLYLVDDQHVDANGDPLNKHDREEKHKADAVLNQSSPVVAPNVVNPAHVPAKDARASKKDSK